jgi:ankyrin repeat protein
VLTWRCAPQDGCTSLHLAANEGHSEVVKLLLEAGSDITVKSGPVSGRSVGDGGLGIRTRRDFEENWQPWGILDDLPGIDDCFLAPAYGGV